MTGHTSEILLDAERERLLWAALETSLDAVAIGRLSEGRAGEGRAGDGADFVVEACNPAGARWFTAGHEHSPGETPALLENLHLAAAAVLTYGARIRHRIEGPGSAGSGPAVLEVDVTRIAGDRVLLVGRDITRAVAEHGLLSAAYEETAQVRAILQTALDSTALAFAVYDVTRDDDFSVTGLPLVLINAAGARQLEVSDPGDLTGGDLRDLFPDATSSGMWQAVLDTLEARITTTFRYHETDRRGAWLASWDHTMAPVGEDRVVVTWRDVTQDETRERELSQAHAAAQHASRHDALTGLANRLQMRETLQTAIQSPGKDEFVGLVYVDLDGFKKVNDVHGHASGDLLLQAVARRIARLATGGDLAIRLGGDEFVLLLRHLTQDWDATGFLGRCRATVEQPVTLPSGDIVPRASFGLVTSALEHTDFDALLELADRAMYTNKQAQRTSS